MPEEIKVSVIVPVYNGETYIEETAGFITNQTLKEIEIIYVDDGSTDNTTEILQQIKKQDKRVLILKQNNQYAGVARNTGLKQAKGKYVVFWDSDDIFHLDALEKMYKQCEKDQADICLCGANHFDEETGMIQKTKTYLKPSRTPEQTPFGHKEIDIFLFNFSTNVPWNKMYRRKFLMEHQLEFQDIPQANDNYFVMKAYFYAKTFTVVRENLIDYRINYGTSLTGNASKTPRCVYEAYEKTFEELKIEENFKNVEQSFYNKALRGFLYFLSKQTDIESYKVLYQILKKDIIEAWGFPENEEYFYSQKDYNRLCRIRVMDAEQYLLTEFNYYFKDNEDVKTKKNLQIEKKKETIVRQKEIIQKKKDTIEKLKVQNQTLKDKIKEIKGSTTYKVGRVIMYIPIKIKEIMRGR